MTKIVVILPTYNEAENLPILVPRILDLEIEGLNVLIVDDDSPDGTGIIADELSAKNSNQVQVLHRIDEQRGLGAAYFAGFNKVLAEETEIVIGMDADLSHDPEIIPQMVDLISQYDLIVGSRYVPKGGVDGDWGMHRIFLSRGAQFYIRLMLNLKTRDTTSALRCYRRSTLNLINFRTMDLHGFSFLIESIYRAERLNLRIKEIPIWFEDRTRGDSKVSLRIIINALLRVFTIRLKYKKFENLIEE